MIHFILKNWQNDVILQEFLRYGIVGGISFLVDFGVLFLFYEFIFYGHVLGLYLAAACGFIVGLIVNTLLSVRFVFIADEVLLKKRGRNMHDVLLILLVAFIGLILTEVGMYIGTEIFSLYYTWVKVFVTGMVLLWNYSGRKVFVFS